MGIYERMHSRIGVHTPYIHCFPHHPPLDARDKQLGPHSRPRPNSESTEPQTRPTRRRKAPINLFPQPPQASLRQMEIIIIISSPRSDSDSTLDQLDYSTEGCVTYGARDRSQPAVIKVPGTGMNRLQKSRAFA